MLQHRLRRDAPELLPALHERASRWYEAQQMLQEAIDHARATSDDERVADIIERHGHAIIVSAKPLAEFLIGPVEIVVQMLLFSVALFLWERRSFHKQDKKAATS